MKMIIKKKVILLYFLVFTLTGCENRQDENLINTYKPPLLEPDYTELIIPYNIAPLNFKIREEGNMYLASFTSGTRKIIEIRSHNGIIKIPGKKWKKMLASLRGQKFNIEILVRDNSNRWLKFNTVSNTISEVPVDPYLSYRLIYPGYESWNELSIKQRDLENFRERSLIENSLINRNCINCHAFNNGRSDDFLFHMRGNLGGTYFYSNKVLKKTDLKTKEMKNGAVYPRWHPSGKFVAFSSNKIVQQFHAADNKKVEVTDLESSLVLYDVEKNEISEIKLAGKDKYMDTYPEWSPDGRYLYFCRADTLNDGFDYKKIRYNLFKVGFDLSGRKFGEAELVYNAAEEGKSVSFPRISPDGKIMVLTLADYGCFPIWHKEADLYSISLDSNKLSKMDLNSDFTDSYHSWSSNSRWLVFSSKRSDGLTARPYLSYIDANGKSGKPFILPDKDPEFYKRFLKSYNVPEFSTIKIHIPPGKIRNTTQNTALPAVWSEN